MSSNTDSTIFLKGPDDWDEWDRTFKSKADSYALWEHIDPDTQNPKAFLKEPGPPKPGDFHTAAVTPASSTEGTGESQTQTEPTPVTIASLSAEEKKSFQLAWTVYNHDFSRYTIERNNIKELKNWVTSSVTGQYRRCACEPTDSIRGWYSKIKEHTEVGNQMLLETARTNYKKAVLVLKQPPKDLEAWVSNWEQTMSDAQSKKVPDAMSPGSWFNDFLNAVTPIMDSWTTSYRLVKEQAVTANTMTFRILANDFRKEIRNRQVSLGGIKPIRGSFGPTFGPKDSTEGDAPSGTGSSSRKGSSAKENSGKGHKREASTQEELNAPSTKRPRCSACNLTHKLSNCYYAFPERAPEHFMPREQLRK